MVIPEPTKDIWFDPVRILPHRLLALTLVARNHFKRLNLKSLRAEVRLLHASC